MQQASVEEVRDSDSTACEGDWGQSSQELRSEDDEEEQYPPLQKDWGFDAQYFERPRFPHSPAHMSRPFLLTSPDTKPAVQIPAPLNKYLRDYQQQGVRFLYSHYVHGKGAVLCDDMGLGKTVQVIAFMCAVLGKTNTKADLMLEGPRQVCSKGCFLVVCPGSVLYNWTNEVETWSHLKYAVYHLEKKKEALDKAKRQRVEVLLTTPDTVRTHVDNLNSVEWLAVFCDEVQVIKGIHSQVTSAMNKLRVKTRYGLTGTALQNNLSELWSILNWARPGRLQSLSTFQTEFERPILVGQRFDCTKRELADGARKQGELELKLKQLVLRRTKALIASQLPTKEEVVLFCPLTELQESIYRALLDCEDVQLILHSDEPCDCYSGEMRGKCCYKRNKEGIHWPKLFAEYICLFNKCANHLGLLLPTATVSDKQREKGGRACEAAFAKYPQFVEMSRQASFLTLSDPQYCGKMQVLQQLLSKFHKDRDKVIIFSHSTKLLNIVQDYLVSAGYSHSRLDGSTRVEERCKLVQSFNSDLTQFVFLVSKKCGGVGLNLTGANRVVIYDPSWNPATDQQAEDRAFRIGQSRDVKVYRLVTEGTVEEMVYLRQVYKQQLANMTLEGHRERRYFTGVAGDGGQRGELFGCANLLQLRKPGSNLTLDILKRAEQMESGVKQAPNQLAVAETRNVSQVCISSDSQTMTQLPGTTALMHSGLGAVVGNSRVEEHIKKQATSDVYELQQHSQQPANVVENKMEDFSDESDDVGTPPSKRSSTLAGSQVDASTNPRQSLEKSPPAVSPKPAGKTKSVKDQHKTSCRTEKGKRKTKSQNCCPVSSTSAKTPTPRCKTRTTKTSPRLTFISSPSTSTSSTPSSYSTPSMTASNDLHVHASPHTSSSDIQDNLELIFGISSDRKEIDPRVVASKDPCGVCCLKANGGRNVVADTPLEHPDISELFSDPQSLQKCVCETVDGSRRPESLGKATTRVCESRTDSPVHIMIGTTYASVHKSSDIDENSSDTENTVTYSYDGTTSAYVNDQPLHIHVGTGPREMRMSTHSDSVLCHDPPLSNRHVPFVHVNIDELFG